MPVGTAFASPGSMPVIRFAATAGSPDAEETAETVERERPTVSTVSVKEPHSPHEGHCPTHLDARHPQAEQR